jgi:dTDP-L-rhamnose 4-epimerase
MLHGLPPVIYEDGQQLRDYVYIADVVAANLLVMEKDEADFQAFNVAGMRSTSVREFAEILSRNFEDPPEALIPGEYRLGDTRHTFSTADKLRKLGWQPKVPVEEIIARYVAWVREQQGTEDFSAQSEALMKQRGVVRKAGQEVAAR